MNYLSKPSPLFYFPWREGNHFQILVNGSNFFPKMLEAINSAHQTVLLEIYLTKSGTVADRFIDAIQNAANRGVQVYILLDDYGSIELKDLDRERLEHNNIQVVYYNKLSSHNNLYNIYRVLLRRKKHVLYRNHRKLLLVDNNIAFTGGVGLVDEFDPPDHPEKAWRETMIKIQGPVVRDWQQLFVESWNKNSQQSLSLAPVEADEFSGTQAGRVAINNVKNYSELLLSLTSQIYHSKQRVWFSTAYFVPGWRIRRMLKRSARAGVDVRLLLPGPISDHPTVRFASHRFYGRLLKNGVRIFEYQPSFLHSKCVLCDDWVTIGSSNFDRWNLRWNLEANQEIKDKILAKKVKEMFEQDFSKSVEVTHEVWQQRSWHLRLLQWFWKQIERLSQKIGR